MYFCHGHWDSHLNLHELFNVQRSTLQVIERHIPRMMSLDEVAEAIDQYYIDKYLSISISGIKDT
jgi:hypothetical protein